MSHRPTATPDFPYTTLFRSSCHRQLGQAADPDVDLCAIASCGGGEVTVIERVDQLGEVRMRLTCRSVDQNFSGRHQLIKIQPELRVRSQPVQPTPMTIVSTRPPP